MLEVLKDRSQIAKARNALTDRGLSCLSEAPASSPKRPSLVANVNRIRRAAPFRLVPPGPKRLLKEAIKSGIRKFRKPSPPQIGDYRKSWDVHRTLELLEQHIAPTDQVIDFGAYGSEILPILERAGFTSLVGIDLDPALTQMRYHTNARMVVGDMLSARLPGERFSAITSISVIEHGFDQHRLLSRVSQILRPGGLFIASFDYWPEKIDTSQKTLFGLSWNIFSEKEIEAFFAQAEDFDLMPLGPLSFTAGERCIDFEGHSYTFGLLAFRKRG